MSTALVSALSDLVAKLEREAAQSRWPAPEAGFAAYVLATTPAAVPSALAALGAELRAHALADDDETRWRDAPLLAAAGYTLADEHAGGDDGALRARWLDGVDRLAERDPFPPDRASFFYRPVDLLGLSRGAAAVDASDKFRGWLTGVARDGQQHVAGDLWHQLLGAQAAATLGVPWATSLTPAAIGAASVGEVALLVWSAAATPDLFAVLVGTEQQLQRAELERLLLERALFEHVDAADAARAAVAAAALRQATEETLESAHAARWQVDRPERDATELVLMICRRFPRFARQLATRHDSRTAFAIDDEYDLQDALHAVLRLHFDDVRAEEWTPSYGGARTRMDFLLKRERTVIETKMTRARLDQRKVVDELTIDKAHYRGHADCRTLVCFVYDPDQRLNNPDALEGDLSADEADLTTRVVVAPGAS